MGGRQHTSGLASPVSCPHSDCSFSFQTAPPPLAPCCPPVGSPWPRVRLSGWNKVPPPDRQMGTLLLPGLWSPGIPQTLSSDVIEGGRQQGPHLVITLIFIPVPHIFFHINVKNKNQKKVHQNIIFQDDDFSDFFLYLQMFSKMQVFKYKTIKLLAELFIEIVVTTHAVVRNNTGDPV